MVYRDLVDNFHVTSHCDDLAASQGNELASLGLPREKPLDAGERRKSATTVFQPQTFGRDVPKVFGELIDISRDRDNQFFGQQNVFEPREIIVGSVSRKTGDGRFD